MHINVIVVLPLDFLFETNKGKWLQKAESVLRNAIADGRVQTDGYYLGWDMSSHHSVDLPKEIEKASGVLSDTTPYVHRIVTPDADVKDVPWRVPGWSTWGGDPRDLRVDFHGYPYMVFDLHV